MAKVNQVYAGLIAGAAVGAVIGLLFAPKPGRESRRIVAARADDLRQKVGGYVTVMRSRKNSKEEVPVMSGSSIEHGNSTN